MAPGKSGRVRGEQGERLAEEFLRKLGCKVLRRNWHSRLGEIDLIVRDGDEVVFVEVKLRASGDWGAPQEAVHLRKEAQHLPCRERVRGPEPPARAHAPVRRGCRAPAARRRAGNPALQRRIPHRASRKLRRCALNPGPAGSPIKKKTVRRFHAEPSRFRSGRLGLPPAHHPAFPGDRSSPPLHAVYQSGGSNQSGGHPFFT